MHLAARARRRERERERERGSDEANAFTAGKKAGPPVQDEEVPRECAAAV